jgi:ABC-type bacteriocin/lantibiotic exporter with double-glycine peptidase domain
MIPKTTTSTPKQSRTHRSTVADVVLKETAKQLPAIIVGAIFLICGSVISLTMPLIMQRIFDYSIPTSDYRSLCTCILVYATAFSVGTALGIVRSFIFRATSLRMMSPRFRTGIVA